jgi:hypothetical protein
MISRLLRLKRGAKLPTRVKLPKKMVLEDLEYRVGHLEVGPKDLVVVSTDMLLTREQCRELQKMTKQWFPKNRVLVMTAGLKLGVVRR